MDPQQSVDSSSAVTQMVLESDVPSGSTPPTAPPNGPQKWLGSTVESMIPPALLEQLTALRPMLERQGVLQLHRSVYRVRYRAECDYGYLVQRSLMIGSDLGVVNAVAGLLERWRTERQALDAKAARQQAEARLEERKGQVLSQIFTVLQGGGRRRQRQLRRFFRDCLEDPVKGMRYLFTHELPPAKKPGRPVKQACTAVTPGDSLKEYMENLQRRRAERAAEAATGASLV